VLNSLETYIIEYDIVHADLVAYYVMTLHTTYVYPIIGICMRCALCI